MACSRRGLPSLPVQSFSLCLKPLQHSITRTSRVHLAFHLVHVYSMLHQAVTACSISVCCTSSLAPTRPAEGSHMFIQVSIAMPACCIARSRSEKHYTVPSKASMTPIPERDQEDQACLSFLTMKVLNREWESTPSSSLKHLHEPFIECQVDLPRI